MEKAALREKYKRFRENLTDEFIEEESLQIANECLKLPIWDKTYFHLFLSMPQKKEVDTQYLLHILQGKDKSVVLSKSNFSDHSLTHILLQENTLIKTTAFGIPEPLSGIEVPASTIDVVFVPLLAFDLNGRRIGYGKGFYDRFLAACRKDCIFVGLSLFEAEAEIFSAENDVPLHYCVTPKKTYAF